MAWKKHILFWIVAMFATILIVPFFASPVGLWANAKQEVLLIEQAFGRADTIKLTTKANEVYKALFLDTGLVKGIEKAHASDEERKKNREFLGEGLVKLTDVTNNYVLAISAMTYVVMIRLFIILSWLPYIFPWLGAVAIDGVVRRKLRMAKVGASSPVTFSLGLHAIIVIIVFPAIYLIVPFTLSPFFMPFWALIIAVPLLALISNIQPLSDQ